MTQRDDHGSQPDPAADSPLGDEDRDELVAWLRAAFQEERAADPSQPRPAEEVEALLEGRLQPAEAEAAAGRLLDAPNDALELRVAAALRAARDAEGLTVDDAAEIGEVVPISARAPRRQWLWGGLAAVAAALVATWFLRAPRLEAVPGDRVRAGVDTPVVVAESPTSLPREAFLLRWAGGPPGATYDLYITTPDLVAVYQALDQPQRSHRVPPASLAALASGQTLLWRVVAVGPGGRRIHSNAFEVTLE